MSVPAAFIAVVVIWSTTPLAIQWSGEGGGFLFGVTARMVAGALLCALLMLMLRVPLPLHRDALKAYAAAGLGIFGGMTAVYWGAQFIPSGWISLLFGLSPIITGALALLLLREASFTRGKVLGLLLAIGGLVTLFGRGASLGEHALLGIGAVLVSVLLHSLSGVLVKRAAADVPAMAVTAGGLLVAAPAYLLTWYIFDRHLPGALPVKAWAAIAYLAVFGSVVGFIFYYYVLRSIEASRTALITVVTPVIALLLGHYLNSEALNWQIAAGTALILSGLACHQWSDRWMRA